MRRVLLVVGEYHGSRLGVCIIGGRLRMVLVVSVAITSHSSLD